jgi:hypothetical protein
MGEEATTYPRGANRSGKFLRQVSHCGAPFPNRKSYPFEPQTAFVGSRRDEGSP